MDLVVESLMMLLFLLTCVVGSVLVWRRWYVRCALCSATISRRFPYCPWCSQMQFSKTRRPPTSTSRPPRPRASLSTGERLALLVRGKRGTPPARATQAAPGTVVLEPRRKETRIAHGPEPTMMGDTTVGTSLAASATCQQCGGRIEGKETFCGHCGQSVSIQKKPRER